ncbi:MAG: hypothetical protein ACLPVY_18600 [Acidimicrobiia bacterium]
MTDAVRSQEQTTLAWSDETAVGSTFLGFSATAAISLDLSGWCAIGPTQPAV